MKRYAELTTVSVVWLLGCVFAAHLVADKLAGGTTRTYMTEDGAHVTEVMLADSQAARELMFSPAFAIPATIVLVVGWVLIWRHFSRNSPSQ